MKIISTRGSNLSAARSAPCNKDDGEWQIANIVKSAVSSVSRTLDLAVCDPKSLSCLPQGTRKVIVNNLAQQITHLILPRQLEVIPEWVNHFSNLAQLEVPNYLGKSIDLAHTSFSARYCVVHTSGPNLSEVHVQTGTVVRYCDSDNSLLAHHHPEKKIRVFQYEHGYKSVQTSSVLGQMYFASDPQSGQVFSDNHNMRTALINLNGCPSSTPISCRHLSYYWAMRRQKENTNKQSGAHFIDKLKADLSDLEKVQRNIPWPIEDRYLNISRYSSENYLVGISQWGKCIQAQFLNVTVPSYKHILIDSGIHAMMMELKTKKTEKNEIQYIALLYEPNWTLTHRRCVENDLDKVSKWAYTTFLSENDFSLLLGEEKISRWVACEPLHEQSNAHSFFSNIPSTERVPELFATDNEMCDPSLVWHLFANGLSLTSLKKQLALCRTNAEKVACLSARNTQGTPGLYMALQDNHAHTLRSLTSIIREAMQQGWLDSEQLNEMLAAKNTQGVPGLYIALQEGHTDAIIAFGELMQVTLQEHYLNIQQVEKLLMAEKANGIQGIQMALKNGHNKAIFAFSTTKKIIKELFNSFHAAG